MNTNFFPAGRGNDSLTRQTDWALGAGGGGGNKLWEQPDAGLLVEGKARVRGIASVWVEAWDTLVSVGFGGDLSVRMLAVCLNVCGDSGV